MILMVMVPVAVAYLPQPQQFHHLLEHPILLHLLLVLLIIQEARWLVGGPVVLSDTKVNHFHNLIYLWLYSFLPILGILIRNFEIIIPGQVQIIPFNRIIWTLYLLRLTVQLAVPNK